MTDKTEQTSNECEQLYLQIDKLKADKQELYFENINLKAKLLSLETHCNESDANTKKVVSELKDDNKRLSTENESLKKDWELYSGEHNRTRCR